MKDSKLLISFPDQSESFTYGVEYGRILQKIDQGDENVDNNLFPIRVENKELLRNTCKTYGYIPIFTDTQYPKEWVNFTAIKSNSTNN